jgi:hypothetical protein
VQALTGQCQCGAVRYSVQGQRACAFVCHCTDCQRQSASAFGMAAWVDAAQLRVEQGTLTDWVRTMPSGKQMLCRFCGVCGSRLFHQVLGARYLSIKTGSLDDPTQCAPVAHMWVQSKQPWVQIPPDAPQFGGNPTDMNVLLQAWAQAHPQPCE